MGRHGAGRGGEERPLPAAGHLTGGSRRAPAGPPAPARDRAGAPGHAAVAVAGRCDVAGSAFRAGGALARGRPGGGGRRGRAAVDRRPRRRRHQGAIRGGGRHRWGRAGELLRAAVRTSPRRRRRGERRSARRGEAPPGGRAAAEREGARRDPAAGARRTGDAAGAGGAMKTLARLAWALTLVALPLAAQQRPRGTVFADGAIVRFGEVGGPAGSFRDRPSASRAASVSGASCWARATWRGVCSRAAGVRIPWRAISWKRERSWVCSHGRGSD